MYVFQGHHLDVVWGVTLRLTICWASCPWLLPPHWKLQVLCPTSIAVDDLSPNQPKDTVSDMESRSKIAEIQPVSNVIWQVSTLRLPSLSANAGNRGSQRPQTGPDGTRWDQGAPATEEVLLAQPNARVGLTHRRFRLNGCQTHLLVLGRMWPEAISRA